MTGIIAVIIGIILFAFMKTMTTQPGRSLSKKFQSIGAMTGKKKEEIIKIVGPPTATSTLPNNQQLLQWQATGYHISIRFDENGIFGGITHEHLSQS